MENFKEVADLLYKYIREDISAEESVRLQNWVQQSGENRQFFDKATDTKYLLENVRIKNENLQQVDLDQAWQHLKSKGWEMPADPKGKLILINWRKFAVAASLIVVLAGAYLWLKPVNKKPAEIATTPKEMKHDVSPDTKNAVLTLADGTTIILDSAQNGMLAKQGETKVSKTADGQLVYEGDPLTTHHSPLTFNTITVPKGSDIVFITLADGTKVWMNAASSIRYPTKFAGHERKVQITGEAYFEVASSVIATGGTKRPFIVEVNDMAVEVLGTHFNINSYSEESEIKTTLLEGRVSVSKGNSNIVLIPGQQASLNKQSQQLNKTNKVDVDIAVAWRFGYFQFNEDDLQTVLRQLVRWYDVEVIYQGSLPQRTFWGKISRSNSLSQVLKTLETNEVHFKIEGGKIIVSP